MARKKILFVCTGNSCRSVMAEGLLCSLLQKRGRTDVQVLSAGTNTFNGIPPTPETIEVMQREGMDLSAHAGQELTPDLIRQADAVFCMEDFHRDCVLSLAPEAEPKAHLLKTFRNPVRLEDPNIPDPVGRPLEVYEGCLMTIQEEVGRVIEWLEEER